MRLGQSSAVLISAARARTSPARARMSVRSACAFRLRGGKPQQIRADSCQPGQGSASKRSSFRRLSTIERTFRAWATITSCPSSLNTDSPRANASLFRARSGCAAWREGSGWKNDETNSVEIEVNAGVPITLTPHTKLVLVENTICSSTEASSTAASM